MNELVANEYFNWILLFLIYLAACLIMLGVGRAAFVIFKTKVKVASELVEKDNLAFSFLYVGYFLGLLMAIGSAVVGPSAGLAADLIAIAVYGLLAIILLNLSSLITDKLLLNKFSVQKEVLQDRNVGTGIIEAANYVAGGLIIFGAVTGESSSMQMGIITAVSYWLLGQIILLITGWIYQKTLPFDVHEHIEKDNAAVGIGFAGALIAIANLIRNGLMGEFSSVNETLVEVGFEAGLGLISIPIVRLIVDKLLLPGQKLTDELINQDKPNAGAGLIEATAYIGGSVLIIWCI